MARKDNDTKGYKSYIDEDGEALELGDAWFAEARPALEVFEELGPEAPKRGRPPLPAAERKKRVTIMLDREVIEHFKKGGKGWQTRANAALRKAAGLAP